LITANIVFSVFNPALRLDRRGRLLCSIDPLVDAPSGFGAPKSKPKARPKAALERGVL
jgi:hypothetical protein